MPSVWSAVTPSSTAFGPATLGTSASVIALPLLPFSALQAEPGNQDRRQQKWNHGCGDSRAFAQVAAPDSALIAERGHQMGGVGGPATGQFPDQLEVGESEQHRERHHH